MDRFSRDSILRFGSVGILAIVFVASALLAAAFDRFPGDLSASVWVQSWNAPWIEALTSVVSLEENGLIILALMALVVCSLFFFGLRRGSYFLLGCTLSGTVVVEVAKALIPRPRPASDLILVVQEATSHSFPSGNVSIFSVYLIALAYIVTARTSDRRKALAAWAFAVVFLGFIGYGRIYLGAHWLSDVLGGYLLGLTWVLALAQIIRTISIFRDGHEKTG